MIEFSIVIPTYNRKELIVKTIDSIYNQTFKDFELIVIDDGSTDGTAEFLEKVYSDEGIQVISLSENRGIGYARSEGVSIAKGKYIAMADSDDTWAENKLELQFSLLQKHPKVDFISTSFSNENKSNNYYVDNVLKENFDRIEHLIKYTTDSNFFLLDTAGLPSALLEFMFIHQATIVFKASIIKNYGNYKKDLSGSEDLELFIRFALRGCTFGLIMDSLVCRNKVESSITNKIDFHAEDVLKTIGYLRNIDKSNIDSDSFEDDIKRLRVRTLERLLYSYSKESNFKKTFSTLIRLLRNTLPSLRSIMLVFISLLPAQLIAFIWRVRQKRF